MKPPTPTEAQTQKLILQWLRLHGAFVVRINGGAMKTEGRFVRFTDTKGCPDILACWPTDGRGVLLAVEVKRRGGKASPDQLACLDAIRRAGGLGIIADSLEAVERALRLEGLL
jgi:hypothetical protein